MDNYIDDNLAYARLKPPCDCQCIAHCGFVCMTDGCVCEQCRCPNCLDNVVTRIGAVDI